MNVVKIREHMKNSSGGYDFVYRETLAELVKDSEGKSVEEVVKTLKTTAKEYADANAEHTLTSAKDYANTSAVQALTSAKEYTNTSTEQTRTEAKKYTDTSAEQTLTSAKEYTNLSAEQMLTEAKKYTDANAEQVLTSAKEYADTSTEQALTVAKNYTNTSVEQALISAKKYTDTNEEQTLTAAKEYTDTISKQTLTTAKEYANISALQTLTEAKNYTDTSSLQTLTETKKYTDTSSLQTLTAAKEYADAATPTFVYKCTGKADSNAIANIVKNFFNNGTSMNMKLIITGTMGITFTNTYYAMYINATNARGARVFLDFSDCYIPEITTATRDFLYVGSAAILNVFGLVATATRNCVMSNGIATFNSCVLNGGTNGVKTGITSTSNFINCMISGTNSASYGASVVGINNFINCTINGRDGVQSNDKDTFINYDISGTRWGLSCFSNNRCNFTDCNISGGSYGIYGDYSGTNRLTNCTITGDTGFCLVSDTASTYILNGCTLIGTTYGVYTDDAKTSTVKLTDCQIKGGTRDVYQNVAINSMHWNIKGCSFAGANIYVNGTTIAVSNTVANAYLAIQAYHNLFNQTIE